MILKSGQILAERYRIISHLGKGGMANVYRAYDMNLERDTAIKLLHANLSSDPLFIQRFQQEARAAANLSHPNLVTVYDFGIEQNLAYIVMEYIEGRDLKSYILDLNSLAVQDAVHLMTQICSGVGYAHRAGLAHCDLKPQNILLTSDRRAKITDFGISRALADIQPNEHSEIVWGSPQYLAPEVASGGPPSAASDVYALGIILFELLTGSLPFSNQDPEALMEMHLTTPPPSPRSLNGDIPVRLEQVVLKVLSKEPSARYRNADQLGRVLELFDTGPSEDLSASIRTNELPEDDSDANTVHLPLTSPPRIDWLAIFLGLFAFIAVGGLIPLWIWICLLYPTCPLPLP